MLNSRQEAIVRIFPSFRDSIMDPDCFLGAGSFCAAYDLRDGRVVKATRDASTIMFLRHCRDNPSEHWPVVHAIKRDHPSGYWIIVTEKLEPLDADDLSLTEKRHRRSQSGLYASPEGYSRSYCGRWEDGIRAIEDFCRDAVELVEYSLIQAVDGLIDLIERGNEKLSRQGIGVGADIHAFNLMWRRVGETIVVNDPIYCYRD